MRLRTQKGQSVVELAIMGGIILMLFGIILSHIQRLNDQQYVEMETFRRALEKANTYRGVNSEGAGASVQLTQMQNRRHSDLSPEFRKGSPSSAGHSANVFWAVPKVGEEPDNLIVYKINEDEEVFKYNDLVPKVEVDKGEEQPYSFRIETTTVDSDTDFTETTRKQETPGALTTTRESSLEDVVNTRITYTVRIKDNDNNPDNDPILKGPLELVDKTQWLYRDAKDGQYKYSEQATGNTVERGRSWTTPF
jgi:hypothetical protein